MESISYGALESSSLISKHPLLGTVGPLQMGNDIVQMIKHEG